MKRDDIRLKGRWYIAIEDIPIADARIHILAVRRAPGDQVKVTILRNGVREDVIVQAIAQ